MNPPLTITEVDGSPKIVLPTTLIFPNGSLTRQGGKVTVNLMSAGGGTINGPLTLTGNLHVPNTFGTTTGNLPIEFGTSGSGFCISGQVIYIITATGANSVAFSNIIKGQELPFDWTLGWCPSNPTATSPDTGLRRLAPKVLMPTDGALTSNVMGWFTDAGRLRVTAQFDKTSSAALANVPGLSVNVIAGRTYTFEAMLFTVSNAASGVQVAIGGTATATAIIYEGIVNNAGAVSAQTRANALGTAVGGVTNVTNAFVYIVGTITVNAAGTLTVQFAQNVSGGVASSVLVGSVFVVRDTI